MINQMLHGRRTITHFALTLGVVCGAVACSPATDPSMPEYAPQSQDAAIEAVSLGTSDSRSFDPERSGTEFPAGTDRVVVWYRWDGLETATRMENHWWLGDTQVLSQGETVNAASGEAAWILMMGAGSPLPNGNYRVELLENGAAVTTIPFTVEN